MNKKFKTFIVLCVLTLLSTGCVKYNAKMDIKRDKSVNYEIIYAMQSSLSDGQKVMDDEELKDLKDNGFTVKDYNEDGYVGFRISKNIKNIDSISDTKEIDFSLSDDTSKKDTKMFTVKKGLFKNTYKAKFNFDMNDSSLSGDDSGMDMSSLMSSMDLKYTVNLPYKAKSNNATTVNNSGKQLVWDLTNAKSVEYEFELYNPIFYIIICIGIVLLIAIVIILIKNKKGNNKTITESNNQPINPISQDNNIPTMTNNQIINNTPVTNTIDNQVNNNMNTSNQTMNNGNINNNNNII